MKKIILLLATIGIITSCSNDDNENITIVDDENITLNQDDFLIFGHFYGFCIGESCIETFKLTDNKLFEDTIDDYLGENLDFTELDNTTFEEVKDLIDLAKF